MPSRALLVFPLRRRARRNFYRPNAHRLDTRSNTGEGEDYFFTFEGISSVWLLFYQRFDAALLLWSSPDSWLAMFHLRRCSYIHTDDPSTKTSVHCELEHRSLRSQQFCEQCSQFFPTRRPRHQFPLPANLHRHSRRPRFQQDEFETSSLLDRRRQENIQTYSSYQLVSHWDPQRCFPPFGKNRLKPIRAVFSMNKAQESKQRSTNWRRRHLGHMQQQPRRWPGFDKCVETNLRLDVYIHPWPPGWSFLRRICTSRGSERVNTVGWRSAAKIGTNHSRFLTCALWNLGEPSVLPHL